MAHAPTGARRIAKPGRLIGLSVLLTGTVGLAWKVFQTQFPGRLVELVLLLIIVVGSNRQLLFAFFVCLSACFRVC